MLGIRSREPALARRLFEDSWGSSKGQDDTGQGFGDCADSTRSPLLVETSSPEIRSIFPKALGRPRGEDEPSATTPREPAVLSA